MNFFEVRNNLNKITPDLIEKKSIELVEEKDAIFLNQEQLKLGYDSENNELPKYSKKTLEIKQEDGGYISPSGRIALKNKGDLWNKMQVLKEDKFFAIFSRDKKYNLLIDRYGKNVFGLNKPDTELIIEKTQPKVVDFIQNLIFK